MKINLRDIGSGISGCRLPAAALLLLSAGLGLVTSCSLPIPPAQPDLTRYFVLQQQVRPAGAAEREAYPLVRLKSVDVPAYLSEKPLAVRRGENEIRYLETARWAEPLDQDLARNIRLGLGSIPGLVVLSRYDTTGRWDYDLSIRIAACEGTEDRTVRFTADWVLEPTPNASLPRRAGTFRGKDLAWDGKTPESLVAALSQGVNQLCDALADALRAPR